MKFCKGIKPDEKKLFWYRVSNYGYILSLLALLYILYLMLQPFNAPYVQTPLPVHQKEIRRGEDLFFDIHYSRDRAIPTIGTRTIQCEDGNLVTLTSVTTNLPAGAGQAVSLPTKIPEKTSTGPCKLVMEVTYFVNPLKDVTITYETETFIVLE